MYQNKIFAGNFEIKHMAEPSMGYVRILHAVPDAPNVDVYANDEIIANNLAFSQYTRYTSLTAGNYDISLYVAGTKGSPILTNRLVIDDNTIVTIAAVGTLDTIGFLSIPDSNIPEDPFKSMIRFSHLSPNTPAVDITLSDGTILFSNVAYKQLTPYISIPPTDYSLQVRLAGTPTIILTVSDIGLVQKIMYTIYAVGFVGKNPVLEALLLIDK